MQLQCCGICKNRTSFFFFLIPYNLFDHYNNFGCSFIMVWEWADYVVDRTFSLVLGRSHCGKITHFGTGLVTLWEEDRLRVFAKEAGKDTAA